MKKFFQIIIFFLMLMTAGLADADDRESLKVSDYDVVGFYFRFNDNALNVLKNNVEMKYSPVRIASLSNDDHNIFFTICQSDFEFNKSVAIIFKTFGMTTDISNIVVIYNTVDPSKTDDIYINAFTNIFKTIGVNDEELQIVLDCVRENKSDFLLVNCQSVNKSFHITFDHMAGNGLVNADISVMKN